MPQPYEISCFDYRTHGYYSRSDCIFKCKANYVLHKYGKWPNIYLSDDKNSSLLYRNNDYLHFDHNLTHNCTKFCGRS